MKQHTTPARDVRGQLNVAELVSMPHLGLELAAGAAGLNRRVQWTHTSELEDPGPWLEGGELLIVNGFGIPADAPGQAAYVRRLAQHRLAGVAVSVRAPDLTPEMLAVADELGFPVMRIPRQVPFIELSYLVANASERSARDRLARHLRIFETLRLRNAIDSDVPGIYRQLEQISGYRLALISPSGQALLDNWPWVPDIEWGDALEATDLRVVKGGYLLPLFVGDRVTAYLVGIEHAEFSAEGLAALQHVSTLAALDAIENQRRREAEHRTGASALARALEAGASHSEVEQRLHDSGLMREIPFRVVAFGRIPNPLPESRARDWLADRRIRHTLLWQEQLIGVLQCSDEQLAELSAALNVSVGVSPTNTDVAEIPRMLRQARWSLSLAVDTDTPEIVFTEQQLGISRWLNPDARTMERLAEDTLRPILEHDATQGSELFHTLAVYFRQHGRMRVTAGALYVHEHTLRYRLNRIEQMTGKSLKNMRESFELWLAVEAHALVARDEDE
ncbi:PucR family transcriptional regulator ligand-binding domain-containing protein [Leucobacter sp. NPDC077196]|uniref:PucR family transcriptional regulator n=1 Tax=Leucobacter sp. NPDC077196 TaxID=3154959 RepID=UPI0034494F3E